MRKTNVFLLTKPPSSERTALCLRLMANSNDAVLYLAGDGIYNLLGPASLNGGSRNKVRVCKEDLEARGVPAGEKVEILECFYQRFVEDLMNEENQIYFF